MAGFARDLRYAVRTLARMRAVAVLAIATLALGIGATTTMFSVVHAMLLRIQALLLPVKTLALSKPPRTVESVPTPRVYGIGFDRRCRLSAER